MTRWEDVVNGGRWLSTTEGTSVPPIVTRL